MKLPVNTFKTHFLFNWIYFYRIIVDASLALLSDSDGWSAWAWNNLNSGYLSITGAGQCCNLTVFFLLLLEHVLCHPRLNDNNIICFYITKCNFTSFHTLYIDTWWSSLPLIPISILPSYSNTLKSCEVLN